MANSDASRANRHLLALAIVVFVIAALYLAKIVLLPLALAVLFSFLLAPLVTQLERIRLPRVVAILLVLLTFGTGTGFFGWVVVGQLIQVTGHLADYRTNIEHKIRVFHHTHNTSLTKAQHEVQHLGEQLGVSNSNAENTRHAGELGASPEHPMSVQEVGPSKTSLDSLQGYIHPFEFLLLVVVFTFFMLLQREDLRNRLIRLTGRHHLNLMTQTMNEASSRVSRYFLLQSIVNTCYGAIIFTALHFIHLPHALLWGTLAGILRFVPYIGAPIAALLPTLFSMAVFHGWSQTLFIMVLFFVMEVITANFIEPHLYGKQTGLSSLAILVAAVFWTLIWGPIGLILSVPFTVCLATVGTHVPNLHFLSVLLSDQPVMRPEGHYYQRLLAGDEHEAGQVLETYLKEHSLQELYDSVLVPALCLSEQDRHRKALDDATVNFIEQTTREFVEELNLRGESDSSEARKARESNSASTVDTEDEDSMFPLVSPVKVLCIPVRDDADEIAAVMLAQLLVQVGHHAQAIPVLSVEEIMTKVAQTKPDVVCLSAVPPYAVSPSRRVYQALRSHDSNLKILLGIWNYTGEPLKTATQISGGEQNQISTTLVRMVSQVTGTPQEVSPQGTATQDLSET